MCSRHRTLGIYLVLAALFALFQPAVQAQAPDEATFFINPGAVGSEANGSFAFDVSFSESDVPTTVADIFWTENKTLEWE